MRKHKHRPWCHKRGRGLPEDADGKPIPRPAKRREHGILAGVLGPGPLTLASAKKRAYEYMHSAARKRADPARWAT